MTANANQPASEAVSPAAKRRGPDLTEDPIGRLLIALAVPAGVMGPDPDPQSIRHDDRAPIAIGGVDADRRPRSQGGRRREEPE